MPKTTNDNIAKISTIANTIPKTFFFNVIYPFDNIRQSYYKDCIIWMHDFYVLDT